MLYETETKLSKIMVSIVLLIITGLLLLRRRIQGRPCNTTARLDGKTVIVTGSNVGLGKEAARNFYKRGARVILACRNVDKGNAAAHDIETTSINKGTIVVRRLDLADFSSVKAFATDILTGESRVDILVNNAGLVTPKQTTVDGFDMVFQTNHLGHFLLTNLLLDKIKSSPAARIVNVTSIAHRWFPMEWNDLNLSSKGAYNAWKAYCQSKLATILFTRELAQKLNGADINVYAVHPGSVLTTIHRNMPAFFPAIVNVTFTVFMHLFYKNATRGAQTIIHSAVCDKAAHQTGLYYEDCKPRIPHYRARNEADAKRLWNLCAEMVNLDAELSSVQLKVNVDINDNNRL